MKEYLAGIQIPDIVKFGAMLLIYTFYMAWWASKVTMNDVNMLTTLDSHIAKDELVTLNVIKNTNTISVLVKIQEKQVEILDVIRDEHSHCKAVIKSLQDELKYLRQGYRYEQSNQRRD